MIGLIAALLAMPQPAPDVRVPIRQGKLRCGVPDRARKTCRTLSRYVLKPDGTYVVSFTGLITDDGLVLSYTMAGYIRHGALCLTYGPAGMAAAGFAKDGRPLSGGALARQRQDMRGLFADLWGRESCSRDQEQTGVFLAEGWVDGERYPDLDKQVVWVDPADGFALGPLPGLI